VNASFVKNAAEALYIAAEMEKRAIRLYERAAFLWPEAPCYSTVAQLLSDEQGHLEKFSLMNAGSPCCDEASLLLSAYAAGIMFPGGLTEAARHGVFASPDALIAYAAAQEKIAVGCYHEFAAACESTASETFLVIAAEENRHLEKLSAISRQS
jgi:rubrerythrin